MNKKLETLHKQLVANQKKINNSSRNERIKKLKILKKNILAPSNFDLIFCDPPFKNSNIKELFDLLLQIKILKNDGIIVLHRNKSLKEKFPNYFKIIDERIYGVSKIIFGKF